MPIKKDQEKEYAKMLYIQRLTNKEIAERLVVSEKTIGRWVVDGKWEQYRKSITTTKKNQIVMLYNQLDHLNSEIEQRDKKIGTNSEVDSIRKLTASIKALEVELSLGETIEALTQFINFSKPLDFEFAKKSTEYADIYIQHILAKGNLNITS
jgi:transposase